MARRIPRRALLIATVVTVGAALAGVLVGPASLRPDRVMAALLDRLPLITIDSGLSDRETAILFELRLPRVVLGMLVGAVLSVSGGAYQGVFRNPLADPYLLGVAAGAGLGATLAIVTVGSGSVLVGVAAFVTALAAVVAAYGLGAAAGGRRSGSTLILAGVAVAAFLTAAQTFIQQRNTDTIREVYSWILGRLGTVGWREVGLLAPYAAVSIVVVLLHRRLLDALAVGEEEARSLGLRPERVRLIVVLAATLGTAGAVAVSGLIGFVGIIVPHIVRLLVGGSYRVILPLSVLGGGAFLVVADLIARTVLSPAEVPIGVITAFVGAPFFLLVLRTSQRGVGR
ncbi:MAG: iron ABC transporter permease [Acidimicrobiia bacterium]|nr:iron ABC transporter permease [Acidimicrobiia bacterium]